MSYPSPNAGGVDGGQPFYSTAGQQQTGAPNSDELQLTAQLSRGLAPIMSAGSGGNMSENQDPRGPGPGNVNQFEHGLQHEHGMPSVHSGMVQMGREYGTPDGSMPPRKRSKVSRACDECRRKKVKCEPTRGPNEEHDDQCSNCKRLGAACQYSRLPQKRGPSKGYIKELADRVNTLEGAIQSGEIPIGFPAHQDSPSPAPNTEQPPHKRTFSSISRDFSPNLAYPSQKNWSPPGSNRNLPTYATHQPPPIFKEPMYTSNGMQAPQEWATLPEQHVHNTPIENPRDSRPEHVLDWDEAVVDRYYQVVHSTFPILQYSKTSLRGRLESAPKDLKKAFFEALNAAVRSFPGPMQSHDPQSTRRATQLLNAATFEKFPHSMVSDLICLQAYVLLAIATNNAPSSMLGTTPNSAFMNAVNLAYSMKLHRNMPPVQGDDIDSDDRVARRLWWTVVSLDKWNAASTDRPALIHEYSVALHPEDQAVLGEIPYQITRLSLVLDYAARTLVSCSSAPPPLSVPVPMMGGALRGQLERLREALPQHFFPPTEAPVFHICYWYLRILVELTSEESSPARMSDAALHLVTQLNFHVGVFSPLIHYCQALAALTLLDLLEYESTREDAENALKSLLDTRRTYTSWDTTIREYVTHRLQHPSSLSLGMSSSTVASQSLQRLADLATASGEGRDVAGSEDVAQGGKNVVTAPASANTAASNHFTYFGNLRRLVGNGILLVFENGGESGR